MSKLIVYRQKRRDGGIRSGLEIDDTTVLHQFQPGKGESNPILEWFVDVQAEGRGLPRDAEAARQWLVEQAEFIRSKLLELADELQAGIDFDSWPLRRSIANRRVGVDWTITCSAMRRLEARDIAGVLQDLALNWSKYLKQLKPSATGATSPG